MITPCSDEFAFHFKCDGLKDCDREKDIVADNELEARYLAYEEGWQVAKKGEKSLCYCPTCVRVITWRVAACL